MGTLPSLNSFADSQIDSFIHETRDYGISTSLRCSSGTAAIWCPAPTGSFPSTALWSTTVWRSPSSAVWSSAAAIRCAAATATLRPTRLSTTSIWCPPSRSIPSSATRSIWCPSSRPSSRTVWGPPLHNSHTANKGNILLLSSLHMASSHRDINSLHMGLQLLQQVVMAHLLHNNTPHSKVMELLSNIPNLPLHPQAMVQCNTSHMTESQTPKLSKRL